MKHVNVEVSLLSTEEFASAEAWEVGVWFRLVAYCCQHENSGAIRGCGSWTERTWLVATGVELCDLKKPSKLWTWAVAQPGVLWVHAYPQNTEEWAKVQRKRGRVGGMAKSDRKTEAVRKNGALGGSVISEEKSEAAKENGKKGGRPRKYVLEPSENNPSKANVIQGNVITVGFDGLEPTDDSDIREIR